MTEPKKTKQRRSLPSWAVWSIVIWLVFFWLLMVTIMENSDHRGGGTASRFALLIFSPIFITTFGVDVYRLYLWIIAKTKRS